MFPLPSMKTYMYIAVCNPYLVSVTWVIPRHRIQGFITENGNRILMWPLSARVYAS